MENVPRRPAAFLDRDGVLNVDHGYTFRPEDLEWIATAPQAVRLLNEAGYYVIVVTNQSGVARGLYDEAAVDRFHAHMQERLKEHGAHIDAFYYCPHHPEGVVEALAKRCLCRKPESGLLEQAARDWPIDRTRSFLIGDKDHDVAAAKAFGIAGIKFDVRAANLAALVAEQIAKAKARAAAGA
ncbi:MAG: D-glycero-alpha-D-manno-heptose-1,7-bisphosphate 7-phosphatase [Pseudolabrys sp.]